jgi:hypothetical protein
MVQAKIDLPDDAVEKIKKLKEFLKLDNNSEVIYYAITLASRINDAQKKHNKIIIPSKFPPSGATTTINADFD